MATLRTHPILIASRALYGTGVDFVFEEAVGQSAADRPSHREMTIVTGRRTDRRDQPAFTSKAQRRSEGTRAALEVPEYDSAIPNSRQEICTVLNSRLSQNATLRPSDRPGGRESCGERGGNYATVRMKCCVTSFGKIVSSADPREWQCFLAGHASRGLGSPVAGRSFPLTPVQPVRAASWRAYRCRYP